VVAPLVEEGRTQTDSILATQEASTVERYSQGKWFFVSAPLPVIRVEAAARLPL
jgi:hypothetical protein